MTNEEYTAQEHKLIEKILHLIEKTEDDDKLSTDEIRILKKMIGGWIALEKFGKMAGMLKSFIIWAGWLIGVWIALKTGLTEYLRSLIN